MSSKLPTLQNEDVLPEIAGEELERTRLAWNGGSQTRPKPEKRQAPVLPKRSEKNVFITSALPYVNNVPHLGNIIGCVLSADVFARYCRLRNWNTLYICGTDEYGTATETKALEEKLTPQQICDKYFAIHRDTYAWFNISFDYFGRTTTPQQTEITQELFWKVYNNGYTLVESMEQLLCEKCDRFLADRFVEGTCPKCKYEDARGDQCDGCGQLINAVELIKPRCKICNNMPVVKNSEHIFIDLPKIEPSLRNWIDKTFHQWTHNSGSITNTWLKDGLKPRCITRDLKWGTPVPLKGFENKVFYVWFDAPIGYISITACYTAEWRKWWQPSEDTPVTYYEFMAKDNVPFHAVMFPSTLLAVDQGYKLVDNIMATEYLNYEDGKFSKSRGIGVFGTDAKETGLPADVFRFYLLYVRPESQDTSFSWDDLASKHNNELLNNIGNFVNRALAFTGNFFKGVIPKMTLTDDDYVLLARVNRELAAYNSSLEKAKLKDGIKYMLNISRHGNQYMQSMKPWVLIKSADETDKLRAGTVVGLLCNLVALIAITIQPYMPDISKIMFEQMNASEDLLVLTDEITVLLPEGHEIGKPSPLFTKIEPSAVESLKKRFSGKQKSAPQAGDPGKTEAFAKIESVPEMEAALLEQANKVRELKKNKAEKSEWMPLVDTLNAMKKHLEKLKISSGIETVEQKQEASSSKSEKKSKKKPSVS